MLKRAIQSFSTIFYLLCSASLFADQDNTKTIAFVQAALTQTHEFVIYNPSYFKIDYPYGDVPKKLGCAQM